MTPELSHWSPQVRPLLERLLADEVREDDCAVFDFDNTVICGDIGEAILAILVRDAILHPDAALCPPFRTSDGRTLRVEVPRDVIPYYEALLNPTIHGAEDKSPLSNAYAWAVQIMAGLSPRDIVDATSRAAALSAPDRLVPIEIASGLAPFPAPFLYPGTTELIAALLRRSVSVWVVSASNVWSVRWMVQCVLNPRLASLGSTGIPPSQVIGLSCLLTDGHGRLYKDSVLKQQSAAYRELRPEALDEFRLTTLLEFPVPTYSGKVARILDHLGKPPVLAAGDSPGDLPMLAFSRHRVWIQRPAKPAFQAEMAAARSRTASGSWIIQPVADGKFTET